MSGKKFKSVFILLVAATFLAGVVSPQLGFGATKRRRTYSNGPSGGVYLQTPEPNTPDEHNNRGVELGSKGMWQDAIREHETALAADPSNQTYRTNLSAAQLRYGDVLAAKKDYYGAMKQFRGALYVDPNNGPADEHLDECIKRSGKDPLDIKVRRGMADDADTKGDYETAIVEYGKCVRMTDDGPSHMALGRVYHKAGKDVESFKELKKAITSKWDSNNSRDLAACHRELGDILKDYAYKARDQGRTEDGMKRLLNAGTEYRRAVVLNPADTNAVSDLVEVAREAVSIKPKSFDNHLMLAGAYQLASDFERAKMEYEEAWNLNPEDFRLPKAQRSFWLSVVKSPMTPPELMIETLQKVERQIQENQDDPELLYIYGRGKEAQGDTDMAKAAYKRASSLNPLINPDLSQAISRLGGGGQVQTAVAGQPAKPSAKEEAAAKAQAEKAAKEEAAKQEALKAEQAYAGIEGKIRAGDLSGAQQDLLAAIDKNHADAHGWLLLGNTQEKMGQLDEAAVSYRQASNLKDPAADEALRQINTSRVQPMLDAADKAVKDGNQVNAAASLREALSIAPNLASVHRKLADVLRALGDTKEADKELKKASDLEKPESH